MEKLFFSQVTIKQNKEQQKISEKRGEELSNILPVLIKRHDKFRKKLIAMKELNEKKDYEGLCRYAVGLIKESENLTQIVRMIPLEYGDKNGMKQIKKQLIGKNSVDDNVMITMRENDIIHIRLKNLLPRRYQNGKIFENLDYIRCSYLESFRNFFSDKSIIYNERVVILFKNFFQSENSMIDDDNFDTKIVTDIIAEYVLIDDNPKRCMKVFDYGIAEDRHTEITIFPISRWHEFIDMPFK